MRGNEKPWSQEEFDKSCDDDWPKHWPSKQGLIVCAAILLVILTGIASLIVAAGEGSAGNAGNEGLNSGCANKCAKEYCGIFSRQLLSAL